MIYPKFLPYPSCWLKGIGLLFYNIPALAICGGFTRYYAVYGIPLMLQNNQIFYILFPFFWLLIYWLSIAYLYHFLWGKPDPNPKHLRWLPSNHSLKEGFFRAIFSLISFGFVVLILLPFFPSYNLPYELIEETLKILATYGSIAWIIVTSYCFHIQHLIKLNKKNYN